MTIGPATTPANEAATRGLVSIPADGELLQRLPAGRAVIYLRVSTTDQVERDFGDEGFSIPAQREACRRKAESLGAVVVDEYADRGESARSAARPQLQAMLQRLRIAQDVDYVIVHKVDRLARSREDDVAIVMEIRQAGARVVSATENIDDTPSGKLLHGIMATIAEFYSSNLSAEARKGMEQKARVGGTVGRAPVGYRNSRAEIEGREVRTVVVDEARAPHVRWAFEQFATGEWTVSQMTEELADRGLTGRATRRYPEGPLSRSRVHKMLRNPYYLGIVTYNGAQFAGRHDPIVSEELFEEVQAVLSQRSVGQQRPVRRTHYLKGILSCGHCGSRLGYSINRGKGGTAYPYFFCLGRHGRRRNGCELPYLPAERVEDAVAEHWTKVGLDPKDVERIRQEVSDLIEIAFDRHRKEIEAQEGRLLRLEAEEAKLLKAYYADAVSTSLMQSEQVRIRRERQAAQAILDARRVGRDAMLQALDYALENLLRCTALYRSSGDQVRRDLCFAMFDRIEIRAEGDACAVLAEPYAQLLDPDLSDHLRRERAMVVSGDANAPVQDADVVNGGGGVTSWPQPEVDGDLQPGRCSNVSVLVGVAV